MSVATKVLAGGAGAVIGGLVAVASVMTGLGWALAASREARADLGPVASAIRSDRLAWTVPALDEFVVASPALADLAWTPSAIAFDLPTRDPLGALALITSPPSRSADDRIATGSLGPRLPKVASLDGAAVVPLLREPLPLPRSRPRLASLSPLDGIATNPDDSAHARRTAIYDITARIVYLPSGERLEAHSGLGDFMDDPSSVRHKNQGVTPPNTYTLSLRESLFHGVQAIRLTPANEDDMFGRDGMLAHSYMLGPSGQSNGCISFKDYPRFLQAYMQGEIDRVVVVTRLPNPPAFAARTKVRGEPSTISQATAISQPDTFKQHNTF